jgi:hypothetical protein
MTRSIAIPLVFALYHPFCTPNLRSTVPPGEAHMSELWQRPQDVRSSDLLYGPWGRGRAPNPSARYRVVGVKDHGTNPGLTVRDPDGRLWSVKQPPHNDQGAEGPIEVVLSRVLSAVGYHQPPVYYVPMLSVESESGTQVVPGGRLRLHEESLKSLGEWSWQQNPFVDTYPYEGLLVVLAMFNSSDLKNENNMLYAVDDPPHEPARWYVVRDLGTALGETGKLAPQRGDLAIFEREPFMLGVDNGFVRFSYHGWHQELFDRRITARDVRWAADLLAGLSDAQWRDAFQAGGFDAETAARFIRRLQQKIADGQRLGN